VANDSSSIAVGADGTLWFNEPMGNKIARMTLAGVVAEFPIPAPAAGLEPCALASDHNLWCPEGNAGQIAIVASNGTITEIPTAAGSHPGGMIVAPDGTLWFPESYDGIGGGKIARVALAGVIAEFPLANYIPNDIAFGPDGNIWFTEYIGNDVGRMTPDGKGDMRFTLPTPPVGPVGIVGGPDGNIWFTEYVAGKIGRLVP
jgi:streptogramin lyase